MLSASFAQTPVPHGVAGRVYNTDGSKQVAAGTSYLVNDTVSLDFVKSVTGPPGGPGRYSVALDGTDGDIVYVLAWNHSHYGNSTFTLIGDMDSRDVLLNHSRPSEMNVSIIFPVNNSIFEVSSLFNVTVNVTNIGGLTGTGCSINLTFYANTTVFSRVSNITISLGSIFSSNWSLANFTVAANLSGAANATVIAWCASDSHHFEQTSVATVFNLTGRDTIPPNVTLLSPMNNTLNRTHSMQVLMYDVTDASSIIMCTLILNGQANLTNLSTPRGVPQNFTIRLPGQTYNWTVNCTDSFGNNGTASPFNLTIDVPAIVFGAVSVTSPVFLTAGASSLVFCNGTVNGTTAFNATIYHETSTSSAADDNNTHYSNASCSNDAGNFSCSFAVMYHAENGSWACNLTALNYDGITNYTNISTLVQPLTAIDILPNIIDYGGVAAGNISSSIPVNVSNAGNVLLDLDLFAYGGLENDSLSLNCSVGNITVESQKVSTQSLIAFDSMVNVSYASTEPTRLNLSLPKRVAGQTYNTTYWRLSAPPSQPRNCSGYVVFTAILR